MFGPQDHVSFSDMRIALEGLSNQIFLRKFNIEGEDWGEPARWTQRAVRSRVAKTEKHAAFARDYLEIWLLAHLVKFFPPLLCSPEGISLRVDETFFIHGDRLDWIHLSWPLDEMPELSNFFKFVDNHDFNGTDLRRRFCFFDAETGVMTLKNNSKELFDLAIHTYDDYSHDIAKVITPFLGWSMHWPEADLPSDAELVQHLIPDTANKWNWKSVFGDDENETEQERRYRRTIDEILQAYPNGKTETWSHVERKTGYSRRSIERALKEANRMDWKTQGGQD